MRHFDLPGRSPVYACNGMVATSHPLASSTALKILQQGGNAVDAAIAASAVLGVVEPQMTGIGGDCFCIVADPDGTLHGLNGSGRSASRAHLDWYLERNISDLAVVPAHCVTVPGAVKAWETLTERFGTLDFNALFADAIFYAENGFSLAPRVAQDWHGAFEKLRQDTGSRSHYLPKGKPPACGQIIRLPALARTLRRIAQNGATAMYQGEVAADIARTVQSHGGFLSEEDLANVTADWVNPLSTRYNAVDIFEIPPNGQGMIALILINLLENLNADSLAADSAERIHLEIECGRIAYSVRDAYVADPKDMTVSVSTLLSQRYTEKLASQFNSRSRNNTISLPQLPCSDTVYLSVVDRDQRAVSFINSIYMNFGSGITSADTGIVLQNRGACFVVEDNHPNAIGPAKRPMHTIIPSMTTNNGKVEYCFGVMGGAYQPMGHAHVLCNLIDYGMDPQQALDHHRVFWGEDDVLELERGAPADLAESLIGLGHSVRNASSPHGGGQIIQIDREAGVLIGGSDSRKDGQAQGY